MKKTLLLLCLLFTFSFSKAGGYKIGDQAMDFSLKNVDGKMLSLKDNKDAKGFIVIFTCNHCPFAKAYEDRIISLDKKYASLGFPVIAINPNDATAVPEDSYENMVERAKAKAYTFPYLYDQTQKTAMAYGAMRTPHVFVLKKEGTKYIVKYIGTIDNDSEDASKADKKYVEDAVDAILSGKNVAVAETKAIGCGIKWKE